jgi:hypothetical protein
MYRISHNGHEPISDVDQVEQLEPAVRTDESGRYHVDELSAEPLPSGHTSRRWGTAIMHPDGSVELKPDP